VYIERKVEALVEAAEVDDPAEQEDGLSEDRPDDADA
jgi:hypothetical protein